MIYLYLLGVAVTIIAEIWILFLCHEEHVGKFERLLWAVPPAQLLLYILLFQKDMVYAECTGILSILMLVIMTGVNGAVGIFLKERKKMNEQRQELSVLYQQRQKELDYYQNVSAQLQKMSVVRHEFSNQMVVIHDMLDKDVDAEYLQDMIRQVEQNLKVIAEEDAPT